MFEGTANPIETTSRKILRDDLDDFLSEPVTPAEVQTKADFYSRVQPWLSEALIQAGYPLRDIDARLSKAFNAPDFFNRDAESIANDINQTIKDLSVEAELFSQPGMETSEVSSSPVVETTNLIVETKPLEPLILTDKLPDTLVLAKEQILPDTLILTPEMQVKEPNEPIVLQTAESTDEVIPEKLTRAEEYQHKLDALNAQPFNREAYIDYVFELHTGLHHEYDNVVTSARKNLKRFDGFYAPSATEKQALQMLSSLQGQFAIMQKADTEIGVIRAELTNGLRDTEANEVSVKTSTQNYLDATKKLFANIGKLEDLIEVVKTEEKPGVAEVYRAQFEKMQSEGNQVLRALKATHPLYERIKTAIEADLAELIKKAAPENGGDTAVLQDSSNFMARREQIKNLIAFVKDEQQYQDFFDRAHIRIKKLESQYQNIVVTEESQGVKKSLGENIERIKQVLSETASQVATVGVLDSLRTKKDTIQGLLLESAELLTSLPVQETSLQELTGANVLSDEEVMARIASSTRGKEVVGAQERYEERAQLARLYPMWADAVRRRELQALESGANIERAQEVASKFPLVKIGKAAVMALAVYFGSAEKVNQASTTMLESSMISGLGTSSPEIDQNTINEYLRTVAPKNPFETTPIVVTELAQAQAPEVNEAAPVFSAAPVAEETVPGVILPGMVNAPNSEAYDEPLEIFSVNADKVPVDPGIVFNPNQAESQKLGKYLINFGDKFWDINEGQTLAGKLPVMSQINPYFKQALIDRVRDKINSDSKEREKIGGFGKDPSRPFADQLVTGEYMDLDALNKLAIETAAGYNYLKLNS